MHEIEEITYVNLKNRADPKKEEGKGPDCDKFPNAVGCQIGANATHVDIRVGKGPSAEL